MRTLVVTNDFPPRPGGIQAYVHALASQLGDVVVLTSSWRGAAAFDAAQPFPVVRVDSSVLLPTPSVARLAGSLVRSEGCSAVWFGASAPLGLLGRLGAERAVASTHGHEVGWARAPVTRQALQAIGRRVDVVTYLGEYTRSRLAPCFPRTPLVQLPSGVDTSVFRPDVVSARESLGLSDRPVVVCVSRVVPRKGQDVLVRALPLVHREVPDAALLLVGGGPHLPRVRDLATSLGVASSVVTTGSVPWEELPAHYAAGDVFAMPCRSRLGGLEVEGLGIVFLEASATGLPVVAGRSGGSPDAVRDGVTGHLVDGTSVPDVAARLVELLRDPVRAAEMGAAGRAWVEQEWRWDVLGERLRGLLSG